MPLFKKQLLIRLSVALGLVVLAIIIVQIAVFDIKRNAGDITRQRNELALRTTATESLATLKNDAEKAKPYMETLANLLPPKDRLINFGKELSDLARQDSIELNFDFGGEVAATAASSGFIKFSLSGVANYANWTKFLKDLEKSKLFIKMNTVDLTRQSGTDYFNITAEGQVYFQ